MNHSYKFAHSCGVKPSKPFVPLSFFPIAAEDYIIIHNSKLEKEYESFEEVIDYIIPLIGNIKIIQIKLSSQDKDIPRTQKYEGLSLTQVNFLIKNSKLLITNSPYSHEVSSALGRPSVLIDEKIKLNKEVPSWHTKSKALPKDSFAEKIAETALSLINIENQINTLKPFYSGKNYHTKVLEIAPNFNAREIGLRNQAINIRADWVDDTSHVQSFIESNHVNLITDKKIEFKGPNKDLLNQNILQVNLEIKKETTQEDINFFKNLSENIRLFTRDEKNVQKIRLKFIDEQIHLEKLIQKKDLDIDRYLCNNTIYKSSKIILSNKKRYTSKAAMNQDKEFDPTRYEYLIDCEDFWQDSEHLKLLNLK
mgnify:CR=1 FL=1